MKAVSEKKEKFKGKETMQEGKPGTTCFSLGVLGG